MFPFHLLSPAREERDLLEGHGQINILDEDVVWNAQRHRGEIENAAHAGIDEQDSLDRYGYQDLMLHVKTMGFNTIL